MKTKLLLIAINLILVSCVQDQGATLSCPGPDATGCDSLSTVYEKTKTKEVKKTVTQVKLTATPVSKFTNQPTLLPAQLLRVWVAPWEDSLGDLHDDQYIYLVIKPARWLMNKKTVPSINTQVKK